MADDDDHTFKGGRWRFRCLPRVGCICPFCENDLFPATSSWRNGQIGQISPFLRKFCENSADMIFPLHFVQNLENDLFHANSFRKSGQISPFLRQFCENDLSPWKYVHSRENFLENSAKIISSLRKVFGDTAKSSHFCENSAKMILPLRNLSTPAKNLRKFYESDLLPAKSCHFSENFAKILRQ